jgi:hypothetical protein
MSNSFFTPYIFNPGILTGKLPTDLLDEVKQVVNSSNAKKQPKFTKNLVGSICDEFETPVIPNLIQYVDEMYNVWVNTFKTPNVSYKIDTQWTNYMKKGEFNPNHSHPNALVAYVIWVSIPYKIQDEMVFNGYDNQEIRSRNSCFEFTYSLLDGRIMHHTIPVEKTFEGVVSMFPATMTHCVYPFFTSDGERISIAGNIYHV